MRDAAVGFVIFFVSAEDRSLDLVVEIETTSPRHWQKKYRAYSAESLLNAYKAVKDQGVAVKRAALQFGIPVQTLRDRVKGYIDPVHFKKTKETCFRDDEELTLVEHVETMAELGYGYSNTQLQHAAGELAFDLGKKSTNKPLSNNWLYGFLKRWRNRLSTLKPSKLDSNRARSTTPECVKKYYENLAAIFNKYNLHTKPQNIYNIDETGLQPDHRPPNVIAPTNSKPQAITSPRSTTTTLIGCANAAGNSLPPYFVFKGKRYNPDLMKGATVGTGYSMSDSGWSNAVIFRTYLEDHFLPHVRGQLSVDNPVLVLYDGHASHINEPLVKWAREQNIILFVLPAHTSRILQPLDVGMFGPLKSFYYTECAIYMNKYMGKTITRYEICQLACKAYLKSMTPINILSGFKKNWNISTFSRRSTYAKVASV
ncbi:tigger transposable element-derived protein 1-like [Ruditapes philippinarum]|uniref:tigger transposable element-derived protein 1-like n=1 Tax=Ruditapes philippinarum TaxID=129788 RepID=UPI00295AD6E2|nr:tigger transposable element-derived protein 1-like [Ruditapes philippinarum]